MFFQQEIYLVTKNIVNDATGVNSYYGSGFLKVATLEQNWPNSLPLDEIGKNTYSTARISSKGFETLEGYIHDSRPNGLSHIVLLENNRSPFLDDIFINYENYSYLKKTFDSSNHNFENKIIILKIDLFYI